MNVPESLSHEVAVELLPWIVNDSLDARESEAVRDHAQACVICRRELNNLQQLRDSISQASSATAIPAPDMRSINARIDALLDRQNRGREILSRLREVFDSPWRIAFAAQSIILFALATVILWPEPRGGEFTTLTQAENLSDGEYIRVVFSPDLQAPELVALLEEFELTIIDGPSDRGVYTLAVADPTTTGISDSAVSGLQDNPNVLFAQPFSIGADQ